MSLAWHLEAPDQDMSKKVDVPAYTVVAKEVAANNNCLVRLGCSSLEKTKKTLHAERRSTTELRILALSAAHSEKEA